MKKIKEILNNLRNNKEYKIFLISSFSFLINIAFLLYNLIFGILFKAVWNWSISIYYAILIAFRVVIIFCEKKWAKQPNQILQNKRLMMFRMLSCFMLVIDLSLIAPATLMVLSKRDVNFGLIPTLAVACYTTYKITLAIINYSKRKSKEILSIKMLRTITLKDAIVSVLTMQNTMVMVFGGGQSMLALTAISTACMILVMLTLSVWSIVGAYQKTE